MSRNSFCYLVAGCACLLASAAAGLAQARSEPCANAHPATGRIVVTVSGLTSDKGLVRIGLFNSKATFPKKSAAYRGASASILGHQSTWTTDTIPHGEYAVALYHDENENKTHDRFFLIPLEDYGISGYQKPPLKMPDWEAAKFCLDSDRIDISVSVN